MNVLRNSISHDETQKNSRMVKVILDMSMKLNKSSSAQKLMLKATEMITQYMDVSDVKLYILDSVSNKIFTF